MEDVHLAFLGYGPLIAWLRTQAGAARYGGRVHVVDAVAPHELLDWIIGVDIAVVPIQPSTLNHLYSSPNKVFEAIAVGTPIAGSDFPEFRKVVLDAEGGPLGLLFDPTVPTEIAVAIRTLLGLSIEERVVLRDRCRSSALRRWNWEVESRALVGIYGRLAGDARVARSPIAATLIDRSAA